MALKSKKRRSKKSNPFNVKPNTKLVGVNEERERLLR